MPFHPDRAWPLQGASNFRDLGGYVGRDGRPVVWRRLFRSDHLGALTDADRERLSDIGLAQSFDLRGASERAATPYHLDGLQQHSLAIEPTVAQHMQGIVASGAALTAPIVTELMKDLYRSLVNDQSHRFAELFAHLLQADAPLLFHCTAGKDRTGWAAALILSALGVPRGVVLQDYLLTNLLYQHLPVSSELPADALAVLWRVQEPFLDAAMQAVDADHGGMQRYLEQRMGLSPAAMDTLAARYLQPG